MVASHARHLRWCIAWDSDMEAYRKQRAALRELSLSAHVRRQLDQPDLFDRPTGDSHVAHQVFFLDRELHRDRRTDPFTLCRHQPPKGTGSWRSDKHQHHGGTCKSSQPGQRGALPSAVGGDAELRASMPNVTV